MTMAKCTVYRIDTGEILRAVDCLETDLELQAGEGEAIWPDEKLDDTAWRIVDGEKQPREPDFAELERVLLSRIDQSAETARALHITVTAGQAAVYFAKEAEARAFIDDPALMDIETPHLSMEAARTGQTRAACAAVILSKATEWRKASASIEALRLTGKAAVRAAETAEGKRAAADAVDWTLVTSGAAN